MRRVPGFVVPAQYDDRRAEQPDFCFHPIQHGSSDTIPFFEPNQGGEHGTAISHKGPAARGQMQREQPHEHRKVDCRR
jgi:hypothetical protein